MNIDGAVPLAVAGAENSCPRANPLEYAGDVTDDEGRFDEYWANIYAGETFALGMWEESLREVDAFVRLSDMWSTEGFDRRWNEIGRRPAHDDSLSTIDRLYDEMGIMPHEYDWMLRSAAIKDLVTAFEVYLDSVGSEMLSRQGYKWDLRKESDSVRYGTVRDFYRDCLKVTIDTAEVRDIRELRHILTHQRGELRTAEQREKFGSNDDSTPFDLAQLDGERVTQARSDLDVVVRTTDKAVMPYIVRQDRLRGLDERKYLVRAQPESPRGEVRDSGG